MTEGKHNGNRAWDITWIDKKQTLSAEDEAVLSYELYLPQLVGKKPALSRINQCYQKTARVWEQRWKERVFPAADQERQGRRAASRRFEAWHTWVKGEITELKEGILSVRMEAGETRGNGKPCLMRWGELWNLSTGVPCPVGDLFPGQRKWKQQTLAKILEQGRARRAAGDCFLDRDWEEKAGKLLLWQEPCLTERGLEFYLPQCSLTPAAEGTPVFVVSTGE